MKNRIDSIYIAKCLGIFIVILMHVYDTNEDAWSMSNAVNIMLHSFIMPTFMVLSGFVLGGKDFNDNWLTKKVSKLILLLIVSTAVYWIFATAFPNITLLRGYFELYKGISLPIFLYGNLQVGFGLSVAWYIFVMLQVYVVLWLIQKVRSVKWIRNVNVNILVGIAIVGINVLPYYNMDYDL